MPRLIYVKACLDYLPGQIYYHKNGTERNSNIIDHMIKKPVVFCGTGME